MSGTALSLLQERLRRAHLEAGEISTREIAKRSHGAVSHTTASQVLRGGGMAPSWRSLGAVVAALGADLSEFKSLWMRARNEISDTSKGPEEASIRHHEALPPSIAGAINLAGYYRIRREVQKSFDVLTASIKNNPYGKIELVIELRRRHYDKWEEASSHYGEVIDFFLERGDLTDIYRSSTAGDFAERCLHRGAPYRALQFIHKALSLSPLDALLMETHGDILLALGKYEEAEEVLLRSHALRPGLYICRYSPLGAALKIGGKFEKLESIVFSALAQETDEQDRFARLADYVHVLVLRGKLAEAEKFQRELLQLSDAGEEDFIQLVEILSSQGRRSEAIEELKKHAIYETSQALQTAYANLLLHNNETHEAGIRMLAAQIPW
ncbi:hypothetical protein ACFWA9_04715 [Kitasatospora sp. NPDC059973]|uniref:hypothetical protein n=1 Tax=Kitasatospora sp. NPDC059973 TaxID=3347020 RepID=UPI0036832AF7